MKHIVCAMLEQHHMVWIVARIAASAPQSQAVYVVLHVFVFLD